MLSLVSGGPTIDQHTYCCEAEVVGLFNLLNYQVGYLQAYISSVVAITAAYIRLPLGCRRRCLSLQQPAAVAEARENSFTTDGVDLVMGLSKKNPGFASEVVCNR